MIISQKAKNIFNRLYIYCLADNFRVNYDFLVIIMLQGLDSSSPQSDCVTITSFAYKENINKNQIKLLFYKTFSYFYAIILA